MERSVAFVSRCLGLGGEEAPWVYGVSTATTPKLEALEAGGADYLAKPFSPTEPFAVGDLAVDYERRRVTVRGVAVEPTATEYERVRLLSLDAGRVATFETPRRWVWRKRENAGANLVRNFVKNLHSKLGDSAASPAYLFNERGVGYRMAKPPDR